MSEDLSLSKMCKKCGQIHTRVATTHVFDEKIGVYYWQCQCGTTLAHVPDWDFTRAAVNTTGAI